MVEKNHTVLLIEDNPGDARLIREYVRLASPGRFSLVHRERLADGLAYLERACADLILLDLTLPDSDGLASVRRVVHHLSAPPVVVLTGIRDETLALKAVKAGAQDYLIKGDIDEKLLVRAMNYALERYQLQQAVHRHATQVEAANRALNVLSACNQALVRAEEEQQLMDDVCQIIVEQGGYRMAWIGVAYHDQEKRVASVAEAGSGAEYLAAATIRWDDSEWAKGPAGTAIRTGQPVVVSALPSDPAFAAWQAEAEKRGCRSVMSLPLLVNGETYGALLVYAAELDAFDSEEVTLFAELAGDVAYGLESLRNRRWRRQAEQQLGERERHYRALFENALDVITILEPDGTIRYQSPSTKRVLGYHAEELVGHSIMEFIHPHERKHIERVLAGMVQQPEQIARLEVQLRHKNGTWRHLEAVGRNLLHEPTVTGFIVNSRDVTERKEAEAALHQSRERLIVLHEIEQAILAARSPLSTAEATLDHLHNLIPYRWGTISLFDLKRQETMILAAKGAASGHVRPRERLPLVTGESLRELERGRHVLIPDLGEQVTRTHLQEQLWQDGMYSLLSIPLLSRNRLVGELALAADERAAFIHEHVQIAYEVAASLSVALQNALLFEETERRAQELEALTQVSAAMRTAEESPGLLSTVAAELQQLLETNHVGVALRDPGSEEITLTLVQGPHAHLSGRHLPPDQGITAEVIRSGEAFVTTDLTAEPLLLDWVEISAGAAVCLPLSASNEVIGAIWVARAAPFRQRELRLLTAITDMVANALRRATLHEQTLAHARQIEQIIEAVPDGMLVLDNNGRLALANRAAREFLPLLTEAGVGEEVRQLARRRLPTLLRPPAGDVPWHELEVREPRRIFEVMARPILSGSAGGGTVLMLHDATEERRYQQYLQAQERLATVGQLAAGIAHDFNNIMAIITLYSQSLERNPDLPKRLQYLHTINEQARHAANLITQILDFSRTSVIERNRVDLFPFVKEMVRLLERTVPESVSIHFKAERDVYPVHADPTRLQQMLMNLAVNARDALPKGGHFLLSLAQITLPPEQQPLVPGMAPGEWICLQVADNGSGIKREDLPHIFEPFFTTKHPGQGTGLGLAQVYGIVKQHGGEIGVESKEGVGTRFTIYLPALLPERKRTGVDPTSSATLTTGRGERILLVEDNEGTREAIADILEMFSYRVWSVADGEAALRCFSENAAEIDLVISDMVMPNVDGRMLYRRLKEIRPEVKVIIITGYPLEEEGKSLLEEGILAWIQKPFTAEQVGEAVQAALEADGDSGFPREVVP